MSERGETMLDLTDMERKDIRMDTIYEVRLGIDADDKEVYTKEEILKLLDTVARERMTISWKNKLFYLLGIEI